MNPSLDYPQPYEDEDNRAFISAWREKGRIVLQKAAQGGKPFFYPRPICPYTGSHELVQVPSTGRGRIVSYSIILRPNHPAFNEEVPIILAEIELEEGATLLGRIICSDAARMQSGLLVAVLPAEKARRYPLPVFELRDAGDA